MRVFNLARTAAGFALALAAVTVTAPSASAQGSHFNFVGSVNILNSPLDPSGNTLLLDFFPTGGGVGGINSVPAVDGVFTPIGQAFTPGTIQDLQITMAGVIGTPINPFVSIAGFTFTLDNAPAGNTFGPISLIGSSSGTTATLGVTGRFFGPSSGFYTGLFTTNFAGMTPTQVFNQVNAGPGFNNKSFSAEFVSTPEPASLGLLGAGLLGLVGMARRRRDTV